jgi:hypothetical protein
MRMMLSLLLVSLCLPCGSVNAATWVRIWRSNDKHMEIYVDESSVHVEDDRRLVWAKLTYTPHTAKTSDGKKYVAAMLERVDMICSSRQWRSMSVNVSYEDGSGDSSDAATNWAEVPPDTFADRVVTYMCSRTAPVPDAK